MIKKCQKYFAIFAIADHQKLELAAMYLTGKAETWFDGYVLQRERVTWANFSIDLCQRFCDKTCMDVIEEFNKLIQKTSVEDYQEKFEELKPYMLQYNPHLEEGYFVSSFISGLKEELKPRVKVNDPKTLAATYRQAKLHELSLELESKKHRFIPKQLTTTTLNQQPKFSYPTVPQIQRNLPNAPPNASRQTLMEQRRAQNLCFKCGDKYSPTNVCKIKQLNSMIEEDTEDSVETIHEHHEEELNGQVEQEAVEGGLEISINALTGSVGHSTLRIQGNLKGKPINVLIDSGSTHSFVTTRWAKDGVELVHTNPLAITVANGEKLYSTAKCK